MPHDVLTPVDIPFWVEATAIVAGAAAGSLRAVREHLAISGVVALAVALGLGGGVIRDTLIQSGTPVAFTDSWFLPIALLTSVPVLLFAHLLSRLERVVFSVDALAIGLYSVIGADKALQYNIPPVGAALIGVLAGTGGSLLADLAVGVPPVLFRPGLLLGVASAFGTSLYVAGVWFTDARAAFFLLGVFVVTTLRMISIFTGWGVGSAHQLAERSEAMFGRLPNWHELQRDNGGSLFRRNRPT
ncbi:MAG: TRIC cation channel family protein [Ilumatobacteraceae bacterium]